LQRLRFGHGGIVNAARRDCTRECALVFQLLWLRGAPPLLNGRGGPRTVVTKKQKFT
jgi:hypothetical protein